MHLLTLSRSTVLKASTASFLLVKMYSFLPCGGSGSLSESLLDTSYNIPQHHLQRLHESLLSTYYFRFLFNRPIFLYNTPIRPTRLPNRNFWRIISAKFLKARHPFCHQLNSVKELQECVQWPHEISISRQCYGVKVHYESVAEDKFWRTLCQWNYFSHQTVSVN